LARLPKMSTIGSGFYRECPVYCLCYTCGGMMINDTVISTLLCPKCPSKLPMMNFSDFDYAVKESQRSKGEKFLRERGESLGGAA